MVLVASWSFGRHFGSSGRNSPFVPDQTFEVVGQVGHADLDPRALNADGAHEQGHPRFLRGEDMLERRAHFRAGGVGTLVAAVHRPAFGLR